MKKIAKKQLQWLSLIPMAFLALAVLFPVLWMFRSSLMSTMEMYSWPPNFIPRCGCLPTMWMRLRDSRSCCIQQHAHDSDPVLAGTLITTSLSAYAFARLDFPLKNIWFGLVIGSMLMPYAITLIPIYLIWSQLGLVNTYWPLIFPAWLGGGGFFIFLTRQFMMTIPKDLDEAATIDGCGFFRILIQIIIPLIRPVMVVITIFVFLNVWNDFLGPLIYVNAPEKYTVAVGLALFKSEYKVDWGAVDGSLLRGRNPADACVPFRPEIHH